MYLLVNVVGIFVYILVAWLFSKDRRHVDWRSIAIILALNLVIAFLLIRFSWGRNAIDVVAKGFSKLIKIADVGIAFALPNWVHAKSQNFITSALLPILLILPLCDILTYVGIFPWIIKWIGKGLSKVTRRPKFESFFAIEMMFLGNTEAIAASGLQLKKMKARRDLTIAMMAISSVSSAILASYMQMIPGRFVITAVPLNILNAIIVTNILNPITVSEKEDIVATYNHANEDGTHQREPFISFLSNSILSAGRLVLIITASVIAFVALAALVDKLLSLVNPWLSLEHLLGCIMFPFTWLMGLDVHQAFQFAQFAGTKLITNEFVVMGKISPFVRSLAVHYQAELCVFLTSFANLSTTGMIIGTFKGIVDKKKNNYISSNFGYLVLSGIIVSLMSAGIAGLFVW